MTNARYLTKVYIFKSFMQTYQNVIYLIFWHRLIAMSLQFEISPAKNINIARIAGRTKQHQRGKKSFKSTSFKISKQTNNRKVLSFFFVQVRPYRSFKINDDVKCKFLGSSFWCCRTVRFLFFLYFYFSCSFEIPYSMLFYYFFVCSFSLPFSFRPAFKFR